MKLAIVYIICSILLGLVIGGGIIAVVSTGIVSPAQVDNAMGYVVAVLVGVCLVSALLIQVIK